MATILEELAANERWEAAPSPSRSAPERLANEALAEHRARRVALWLHMR